MANQDSRSQQSGKQTEDQNRGSNSQTGDPGRTPGVAEGDRQTIDDDIRNKEREGKL